jgi:hypothetical protein
MRVAETDSGVALWRSDAELVTEREMRWTG